MDIRFRREFGRSLFTLPLYFPLLWLVLATGCAEVHSAHTPQAPQSLINAADSVPVTTTVYKIQDSATWIVLCHQAGSSRGEYLEIAPKLNKLGYNCLAVDARAGDGMNGVANETARTATELGKPTDYLSAEQDIYAAVQYAAKQDHHRVILFGSSYSASLALKIAAEHPGLLTAVVAFSPGEYFEGKLDLHETIEKLRTPTFVTSARKEAGEVTKLVHGHAAPHCTQFVPHADGVHGAKALWASTPSSDEYWTALKVFLKKFP